MSRTGFLLAGGLIAGLCLYAQSEPAKDAPSAEPQGIPPRATPADYQGHAKAGTVTIAAEFKGHFVPNSGGTLTTEDFVVVEAGLFGEPGGRLKLSPDDFSLVVNGTKPGKKVKKMPLPSQPYGLVVGSLKDPEFEPPASSSSKSKTTLNTGGGGQDNLPPPPVHIPIEVQRAMAQRVQKASLAEGDRALPQAGLLFFPYHGNAKGIRSVELIYNGPAGQASMDLQP